MQKLLIISMVLTVLTACSGTAATEAPAAAATIVPFDLALGAPGASSTFAAYLLLDSSGARLVGGLRFSNNAAPTPIDAPERQVWLETVDDTLTASAQQAGETRYLGVLARGTLESPNGAAGYRLRNPVLTPLKWQETTVVTLAEAPAPFANAAVRVTGVLMTTASEALLIEQVGPGGVPDPTARQIKLAGPLRDAALLADLTATPGGAVRYGMVQVEGVWYGGKLVPLGIRPVR